MTQLIFIFFLIAGLACAVISLLGAIIYDIFLAKKNKLAADHPFIRAIRKRPKVSVIVLAGEDNLVLQRCLVSIARNNYRNIEIIVAAQKPIYTKKSINYFTNKYPRKKIKIAKSEWQNTVKKIKSPGIVVVVDDNITLEKTALSETVKYFALNQKTSILLPHCTNVFNYTISGLIHDYEVVLKNQYQKNLSLVNRSSTRHAAFTAYKETVNFTGQTNYCSNINVFTFAEPMAARKKQTDRVHAGLILGTFAAISYIIYVALVLHYTALMALLWIGFSLFLVLNIWSEEHIRIMHKIRMLALVPMICLLFYLTLPAKALKSY
jgi:hypothetical protein